MKEKIKTILFEKVDSIGLGVFRVFYTTILFLEINQLFSYRHIIYDIIPYEEFGELTVSYIYCFWFIILFALLIGFYTRFAAIINYILSVIVFSSFAKFEYHVFYAYVGINFLLIFIPIGRTLSIDYLRKKLKFSLLKNEYEPERKVYAANYLIPVFIGIGLVYFDSILYKFTSPIWMKGLGMWLPANLPMVTWTDSSWFMNNEYLVKFLGYLVVFFETIFIFTFWFKPFRLIYVCIGMFFHFGILYEFAIPWFALCTIALYILLIPPSFWIKISKLIKFKNSSYVFLYDSECPLCAKTVILIKHLDIFNCIQCETVQENAIKYDIIEKYTMDELLINIHGIRKNKVFIGYNAYAQLFKSMLYTYPLGLLMKIPILSNLGELVYKKVAGKRLTERCTIDNCPIPVYNEPLSNGQDILIKGLNKDSISRKFWKLIIVCAILGQFIVSWFSPLIQNTITRMNAEHSFVNRSMASVYKKIRLPLLKLTGTTQHPVFMDGHFDGYNHIIKVDMFTHDGFKNAGLLDENGMPGKHVQGAFWVNYTFRVSSAQLEKNKLESGLKKYLSLYRKHNVKYFKISVKEIDIPQKWSKDFLNKQISHPWKEVGVYKFKTGFIWNKTMLDIFYQEKHSK